MKDSIKKFKENKFIVVKNFITPELIQVVYQYMLMKVRTDQVWRDEPQVPGTPSIYGDTLTETLMMMVTPRVEELIGKKLYPTFSSMRVYKNGDTLPPHIDRPSGEFGLTLCLGFDNGDVDDPYYRWKIYMDNSKDYRRFRYDAGKEAGPEEGVSVEMEPGDCVIYYGCEVRHWRNTFAGKSHAQAFFMYVDQDGPYAKYRYDSRPQLGLPADTITIKGPYAYFE